MKHTKLILTATLLSVGLILTTNQTVQAADNTANASENTTNNSSSSSNPESNSATNQDQNNESNKNENSSNNSNTEAQTQNGWINQNGKSSYLVNNKPVKGLKQIDKAWYLLDKNGTMLTGFRKIPHQNNYGYFAENGKRRFKNTKTSQAYYWINKSGNITGIKNYAKVISQLPEMPTGCEITAVTMMINFAG